MIRKSFWVIEIELKAISYNAYIKIIIASVVDNYINERSNWR